MKTKRKGEKKKRREAKNRFYPESNSGPSARQAVSLLLLQVNTFRNF